MVLLSNDLDLYLEHQLITPEQHLWSCDDKGNAYFLSSWEAGWRRLRAHRGVQLRVKRIVACEWCVWAIGVDQSPYLLVPSDGTTIRVTEIIVQHERWNPSSGFSASNLTVKDPPEYQQAGCNTYSWTDLPSTRWQWESQEWEYMLEHSEDRAGWEYSTSFSGDAIFSSFYRCDCVVRRRRWQRVRRFLGHDRWLLCSVSSDDLDSQSGPPCFSNKGIVHVHRLAIGGRAIPYQPLGFLILWAATKDGRVVCRTDIHRNNPEGSNWVEWHLLMVQDQNSGKFYPDTHQPFAIDIHVNQYGQALVLTDENQLFYRIGVDFKSPYVQLFQRRIVEGTSWIQIVCDLPSLALRAHEHLVSVALGGRSAWLVANTGRAWFHADFTAATVSSPSLEESRRFWAPMSGRFLGLSISSSDQVFALDSRSNRLIYRSGITPETPGGEVWLALDLPILPSLDDDHKLGSSLNQEGPLSPLCTPQDEAIQFVSRVLQLTSPDSSDSTDDGLERLSVPEDYDPNAVNYLPQLSPAHILGHRLRKFFTRRSRSQLNSFVSFRRLLTSRDAMDAKSDALWMSEDQVLPKIGHPPIRLTSVWAGALSSSTEHHLPHRWRIAALLLERKNLIPYFTTDEVLQPPEWLLRIDSALPSSAPNFVLDGGEFTNAVADCEPWTQTFRVDAIQIPLEDRNKCTWTRRRAVITHFASETHLPEFTLVASPSTSRASVSEVSTEVTSASMMPQKVGSNEISWVGYIDSLSPLIPISLRELCAGGRRKFSDSLPTQKTEAPSEVSKKAFPLPTVPIVSSGHLVAVFVRAERPPPLTTANSSIIVAAELVEEEEENSTVFEEHNTLVRSHIVPRWVLRFSSKVEASAWMAEAQLATMALPSASRVWLVTEQSEIFWAVGTSLDNLTWNRVGGHFARVDSISISAKDERQVTWALGHNCMPWVYRKDWTPASNSHFHFSQKHFPFNTPHVQTDTRRFRVYEFQVRRMLHGYTSSKAFNERGVMWSRDARHQQLCSLCDIHLPPHRGRVHWLDDWKVDFSTLPGSAPHHTPVVWKSRGEEWDWECGGKESPSYSPRGSPRRGYSMDSSVSSPDLVVTLTQSQDFTTTVSSTTFTVTTSSVPPPPSPSSGDFKEGIVYAGTGEGFVYSTPPSYDKKGWLYASRSSSCSLPSQRSKSSSGMRHRRWVRSCAVRTEAPWQEVGPLKLKCFDLSRASSISNCVDVWAVTDSGELVFRCDVTPSNPGGDAPNGIATFKVAVPERELQHAQLLSAMCSNGKRLPHLYSVQPNPFAYTQKYEEALDMVHGKIRQLFSDPNLVHTPETSALMHDIADEVAYLRFDSTLLTNASPEWSKKFTERELVTQRQAFLDTCTLLTDPGGQLTARYQVNMKPGNRDCTNVYCACIELKKDPNADADIGIGWTDTSRRSAENWAVKELQGLRDELKPLAEEAKKRIKQYLDAYGITDRYTGYRNNLGYIRRLERPASVDPALLNPGRPAIAPRWHMGVEDERARAVECTEFVAPQDTECERMEHSSRKCEVKVTCEDPVTAAGIVCKFPGRTEYEDAYIDPPLLELPSSSNKPPRTHRSISEQPPGVRGRGPDVEIGMGYLHDKSFGIGSPPRHEDVWVLGTKGLKEFPTTEYQDRYKKFRASDLNVCPWER
ncbi:Tectonin beta-propeller repeat-containing protein [Taenia solium]|eukprot:TsM_000843800 transcript=TsM_000843800 gene=TsM_000843800